MKRIVPFLVLSLFFIGVASFRSQADRWKAPPESKKLVNPVTDKATSIERGAKLFKTRCMICHGSKGTGDGIGGKALNPKPQNLTLEMVQTQTDGEIFWKITNGRNDMIKWGPILSENQRWDLVNYVKTL